jgi:hypothetical protein
MNAIVWSAVLSYFRQDPEELQHRYVTADKTDIHYFTSETKEASKQCVCIAERVPKKPKTVKLAGQVKATVFWDARGII